MSDQEQSADQPEGRDPFARARAAGYSEVDTASVPPEVIMGMGCGNPVALASLREGEVVVDLGCGGGLDCLLAAERVGPTGRVVGVDASEESLAIARAAAALQGRSNVEFDLGAIERLPLPDASVDVVISNCVISDVRDRTAAFREAARVLRPGGRAMTSDLVVTAGLPEDLSALPRAWADWLAHAPGREDYLTAMRQAGLREVAVVSEQAYRSPGTPPELLGIVSSVVVAASR